jgi:hypothetical protein
MGPEMTWAWSLFARDAELRWELVERDPDLRIAEDHDADIVLSRVLREAWEVRDFSADRLFMDELVLRTDGGEVDALGMAFYLVNSLQEHGNPAEDRYGRFSYSASLQHRFDVPTRDLVGEAFQDLHRRLRPAFGWGNFPEQASALFISHDVDRVFTGWKQDGKVALRQGRLDRFLGLAWRRFFGLPAELDLLTLQVRNAAMGIPGSFFLLPRKARPGTAAPDADYEIRDKRVWAQCQALAAREDTVLGLHRSFDGDLLAEQSLLPAKPQANRNHFLHIRLPDHYHAVEAAGLALDSSLAFAEATGFRNSYARPFHPFNLAERRPFRFLEVPFQYMDTTFEHYRKDGPVGALAAGKSLLEAHPTNAVIGMLWHNDYLCGEAGRIYRPVYEALIDQAMQSGLRPKGLADWLG